MQSFTHIKNFELYIYMYVIYALNNFWLTNKFVYFKYPASKGS